MPSIASNFRPEDFFLLATFFITFGASYLSFVLSCYHSREESGMGRCISCFCLFLLAPFGSNSNSYSPVVHSPLTCSVQCRSRLDIGALSIQVSSRSSLYAYDSDALGPWPSRNCRDCEMVDSLLSNRETLDQIVVSIWIRTKVDDNR